MAELRVGFVGWRGLVGSVLLDRMREEGDLHNLNLSFFSTSDVGGKPPAEAGEGAVLKSAENLEQLAQNEIIITCQGGDYTTAVYHKLRQTGWNGFWIDAASTLRMSPESIIILDPVNGRQIRDGLASGVKAYIGGNCTVSLMLMALEGLFREDLIEWVNSMTYQAVSGAGAKQMIELLRQMQVLGDLSRDHLVNPAATALSLEKSLRPAVISADFPTQNLGTAIAGSLLPWIDKAVEHGQTREEWKGFAEANKILGRPNDKPLIVDGLCVRVGVLRCHSQALLIKLTKTASLAQIEEIISSSHPWAKVVPNDKESTTRELTPAAVSGRLTVPVGRMHFSMLGQNYLQLFTIGDQLLWGAAEPLRRVLLIIREYLGR